MAASIRNLLRFRKPKPATKQPAIMRPKPQGARSRYSIIAGKVMDLATGREVTNPNLIKRILETSKKHKAPKTAPKQIIGFDVITELETIKIMLKGGEVFEFSLSKTGNTLVEFMEWAEKKGIQPEMFEKMSDKEIAEYLKQFIEEVKNIKFLNEETEKDVLSAIILLMTKQGKNKYRKKLKQFLSFVAASIFGNRKAA